MGRAGLAGLVSMWIAVAATPAAPAGLATPEGPVVLTVVGEVGATNRGPMDPVEDALMDFHGQSFERAVAFDRAMLRDLGMETRRIDLDDGRGVQEVTGPPLAAVLDAAGAAPASIALLAIDGYAVEIDADEIAARDWVLGLEQNREPLDLGGRGPIWAVFSPASGDGVGTRDERQRWAYQVFLIRSGR